MWSALGAAAGGALGQLGSGLANAGILYATSKSLAKYNYELGLRSLVNSPGNYKKGLIKAGINPILASNSPIGSTQGSSGVNPGMDVTEGAVKGVSARNLYKQTESNIELQSKQGNAVEILAGAAEKQSDAAWLNALTNAKKAGVEIKGIESNISLNKVKEATEKALQELHLSEALRTEVLAQAIDVSMLMDKKQLDYYKAHPEEFNDYMREKLLSEGNMNSARNFEKWTNVGKAVIYAADTIMSNYPLGKGMFKSGKPDNPFKKYMDKGLFDGKSKKDMSIYEYDTSH